MSMYRTLVFKRFIFLTMLLLLCILLSIANLVIGPIQLSISEIISSLFLLDQGNSVSRIVIWEYRLPWTLMALVVGGALGLTGLQMQTILNNPLASSYTLGVSAGAGFGAALAYVLGVKITLNVPAEFIVPLNAFAFAFLTCVLIIAIGRIRGFTSETIVLAGIAISSLFQSLLALLEYYASEEVLQALVFWLFGSLTKSSIFKAQIVFVILALTTLLLLMKSWKITTLRLGDEKAKTLGVNTEKLRLEILVYVSLLTAVAVCFVGIIGFVGLVAPHVARILLGEDQRFLIVGSMLCGATILSAGGIASKTITSGAIFPIGIITSILGIPFFLFLVIRGKKSIW